MSTTEAERFTDALHAARDPSQFAAVRRRVGPTDEVIGMRMRDLFAAAKAARAMPLDQVRVLLTSPVYEVRMGALCILDFRAKDPRTGEGERERLCRTYLDHHDAITTWDMVDRAAPSVVGGRLLDRDPAPLFSLASSPDPLRRRTAITAPLWFVRYGSDSDVAGLFSVAELLVRDRHPSVTAAVGIALKHAGGRDADAVAAFLGSQGPHLPAPVQQAARSKLHLRR